jgi:ribosomal-protein-alanine N-acetyltransferase
MITPIRQVPAQVREMLHDDVPEVSDIEQRSYEFPWSHGVFRDCLLAGYHCTVVEREGMVVGYGVLSIAAGEAHILNLCVDPMCRELGYGERLLDEIIDIANGAEVGEIFLEVRPSNEKAISLYMKKGFRNIAYRPAYYQANGGREDAAVFSKVLKKRPG